MADRPRTPTGIREAILEYLATDDSPSGFEEDEPTPLTPCPNKGPVRVEFSSGSYQIFKTLDQAVRVIEKMHKAGVSTTHLKLSPVSLIDEITLPTDKPFKLRGR